MLTFLRVLSFPLLFYCKHCDDSTRGFSWSSGPIKPRLILYYSDLIKLKTYVKRYYVMVGVNDLSIDSNETWTERRVEKMYQHPKFEEMKGSSYYDVAIIGESNLIVPWGDIH